LLAACGTVASGRDGTRSGARAANPVSNRRIDNAVGALDRLAGCDGEKLGTFIY